MTELSNVSVLVVLCLVISGILPETLELDLAPKPLPVKENVNDNLLEECRKKVMAGTCGQMIGDEIFFQNVTTSDQCCNELVIMGEWCHKELLKRSLLRPDESKRNATEIQHRGDLVWDSCLGDYKGKHV